MTPIQKFLESSPWHAGLSPAQGTRLRQTSVVRRFSAGASVCLRGSPANHWLGVMEGLIKVETITREGRATTFAAVRAGGWFGEGAALKGEARPYSVVAIRDSSVVFVPREIFDWLIDDSRGFSRWVIGQLNARLAHYMALVESYRLHDLTARVAFCISEMFNPQLYPDTGPMATSHELAISQDEIARLCGLARQNINRGLHTLELAGVLEIHYGYVRVRKLEDLRQYARGD